MGKSILGNGAAAAAQLLPAYHSMARMLNNPWIEKAVMAAPNAAVQPHYVQATLVRG